MKSIGGQLRGRLAAVLSCVGLSLCLGFVGASLAAGTASDTGAQGLDAAVAAAEPSASEVVESGTTMREDDLRAADRVPSATPEPQEIVKAVRSEAAVETEKVMWNGRMWPST